MSEEHKACAETANARFETNTWTGSGVGRYNEDYALADLAHGCVVLVDGATGLTKANLVTGESDASWYARSLCKAIVSRLHFGTVRDGEQIRASLLAAGEEVAAAYRSLPGAADLARIDEPNGSLAVLVWDSHRASVTLLGDCTAVVGLCDGSCRTLHDDTLTQLDGKNYARMFAYAIEHGTTMAEARRALNPRFIENRLKMNEPGGYWAADISCRGMVHATTVSFATDEVAWLFACSDGYAAAVDMGVLADAAELGRAVAAGQGVAVGDRLRAAELDDAGCWRVHRSKTSDDATYAFVRIAS